MILFPRPKHYEETEGQFTVSYPLTVTLPKELAELSTLLNETLKCNVHTVSSQDAASITFSKDAALGREAYGLIVSADGISIRYSAKNGAYYGLVTLGQILAQCSDTIPCCQITDEPSMNVRGYMLDISRGKVPELSDLCGYVDRLAALKYNQLQLYVEGFSFAYPSYADVWKDTTPVTGEEILFLDAYCKARGIELVPNQNSLGHMAAWLSKDEFRHLAETEEGMAFMGTSMPISTFDAMDPASLDLVTNLMDDMLPFFSSDKFNVNLDEPFELGKGKNKALAEEKGEAYIYMDYLKRLQERVAARGKHMYMWGDILANHPETFKQLPEDVTVLDWGYEAFTPFEEHAASLADMKIPFILCPGTSTWTTLTGRTDNMMGNILNAAKAAIAHKGEGVLVTAWGDGGHLEYEPLSDTGIAYGASCCWGQLDTTEEEVANYLNQYVYADNAGKTAQIILDLGRLYHYEEFPMVNMTLASMTMSMGILPDGAFSYAIEQAVRGIQAFAPSAAPMIDAILAGKKEYDYNSTIASIHDLKTRLAQTVLTAGNASLVYAELENTLRIAEFAAGVHQLNAAGMTMEAEKKAALTASLKTLGTEILTIHPKLWIARNKLHGMEESIANIRKLTEQLA